MRSFDEVLHDVLSATHGTRVEKEHASILECATKIYLAQRNDKIRKLTEHNQYLSKELEVIKTKINEKIYDLREDYSRSNRVLLDGAGTFIDPVTIKFFIEMLEKLKTEVSEEMIEWKVKNKSE